MDSENIGRHECKGCGVQDPEDEWRGQIGGKCHTQKQNEQRRLKHILLIRRGMLQVGPAIGQIGDNEKHGLCATEGPSSEAAEEGKGHFPLDLLGSSTTFSRT